MKTKTLISMSILVATILIGCNKSNNLLPNYSSIHGHGIDTLYGPTDPRDSLTIFSEDTLSVDPEFPLDSIVVSEDPWLPIDSSYVFIPDSI